MYLTSLKLQNFRNYKKLTARFEDQVTVLIGANAAGKTNLLEAIRFLSLFKSWRASHSLDLINWHSSVARVEGSIRATSQTTRIAAALAKENPRQPIKRQITLNGMKMPTRAAVGKLLTVLFSPDDILLVSAAPRERRLYLDIVLGQIFPRYYETLLRYSQALEQRNFLVGTAGLEPAARREAEIWEAQMAVEGSRLIKQRSVFIEAINHQLAHDYRAISLDTSELKIIYQPALSIPGVETLVDLNQLQGHLLKNWQQSWSRDLASKQTNFGPHRDDFIFTLNARPLESSGSRGEWRSAVLSLKLGEKRFIEEQMRQKPVLLLDDVFSELDSARRVTLSRRISGPQCFLTATDLSSLDEKFTASARVCQITDGRIVTI